MMFTLIKCVVLILAQEKDTSVCASDPCRNGATCVVENTGYRCSCIPGFSGKDCDLSE